MILKVFAIDPYCIRRHKWQPVAGQSDAYVARTYAGPEAAMAAMAKNEPWKAYPPDLEPFECDSESEEGRRIKKLVARDRSLEPADQATATECGVDFWRGKKAAPTVAGQSGPKTASSADGAGTQELSPNVG